jgi:hypothetical protein
MKTSPILLTLLALLAAGCSSTPTEGSKTRSVYYWKTTFSLSQSDLDFLSGHRIGRIYLRMFDVDHDPEIGKTVPIATARFLSPKPEGIEIVPTVFITLNALNDYRDDEATLANLIVDRVLKMCTYNNLGEIGEIQFDCDWTSRSKKGFERLCSSAMELLHSRGIQLSGTIRLHQIAEAEYPFDRGVLMLYNTGSIRSKDTENSIISVEDVRKYLCVPQRISKFRDDRKWNCPMIDCAYPTYGWGVLFDADGKFSSIIRDSQMDTLHIPEGYSLRKENSPFGTVSEIKSLVDSLLGSNHSNIIYHLDSTNLSKYSYNEIEHIFN